MNVFAKFLNQREAATTTIQTVKGGVRVNIGDKKGLHQIAIAVPSSWKLISTAGVAEGERIGNTESYVVETNTHEVVLGFRVPADTR
jgi:hypothetical protein